MGDALAMLTISEEQIGLTGLHVLDGRTGKPVPLELGTRRGVWISRKEREKILAKNPQAFFLLPVRYLDIWQLPPEPSGLSRSKALQSKHRKLVQRELEKFVNARLKRCDRMIRSGWFILGKARVKVTCLLGVPDQNPALPIFKRPPVVAPAAARDAVEAEHAEVVKIARAGRRRMRARKPLISDAPGASPKSVTQIALRRAGWRPRRAAAAGRQYECPTRRPPKPTAMQPDAPRPRSSHVPSSSAVARA